jgi:hypothetical protein
MAADLRGIANSICRKAGATETCPFHEGISIDRWDEDAKRHAYAMATSMVELGEIDTSREEMVAAIKAELDESYETCPHCRQYPEQD